MRRLKYLFLKSFDTKTQILLRVALIGVIVGCIAVAFRVLTEKLSHLFYYNLYHREYWYEWLYPILICTCGGLFAGFITHKYAKDAGGSGIPQVKHALNNPNITIRLRTVIVKLIGAIVGIASGLSLGREGPTIHIGAGLGSKIARLMNSKHQKRALASGAGAGLAAAFNTPIAGVLFIIEELDKDFSSTSLGPAIVGTVSAAITCRLLYGDFFAFHFQSSSGMSLSSIPLYIILGIVCGVIGISFQKSILKSLNFYQQKLSFIPAWTHGGIAGFLTGIVALWLPEAIGEGHATLEGTLAQAYIWWMIPLIFLFKYILTLVACGSGVPGGIFAPSLILGALLGAMFGNSLNSLFPFLDLNPSTFAFVGMGAFFTAISRAPITSIVMLFELTGNYDLVLPLMFSCIIANVTSEKLHLGGIYENLLSRQGIKLNQYTSPSYLQQFSVKEAMALDPECVEENISLGSLNRVFQRTTHGALPVVDAEQNLVGIVTRNDLKQALEENLKRNTKVSQVMSKSLIILTEDDNLHQAIISLHEHNIGRLLIVDKQNPKKLIGIMTRSDIINFEATKEIDEP